VSVVIGGQRLDTPFESVCWLDDAKLAPRVTHASPRTRRVRAIVLHTTSGKLGPVRPGFKASTRAEVEAHYQTSTTRAVSWDGCVDTDGLLVWQNDPVSQFTWHATSENPLSIGIELVQDDDGSLYDGQLQTVVKIVDFLTERLRIQRQIPWVGTGIPRGVRPRLDEHGTVQGANVVGVVTHFQITANRGPGDTVVPFDYLARAGYEKFDLDAGDDLAMWKARQRAVCGFVGGDVDGVPLDKTCAALEAKGYAHGLWVSR